MKPNITYIQIPNGINVLDKCIFCNLALVTEAIKASKLTDYDLLKCVKLPRTVKYIMDCAFYNCKNLESIDIPEIVVYIGCGAFYSCEKLRDVRFDPRSQLKDIGSSAFRECKSLTNIIIPQSTEFIGDCAFKDCSSLKTVRLPNGILLKYIGYDAFSNCTSLTMFNISKYNVADRGIVVTAFRGSGIEKQIVVTIDLLKNLWRDDRLMCNIRLDKIWK